MGRKRARVRFNTAGAIWHVDIDRGFRFLSAWISVKDRFFRDLSFESRGKAKEWIEAQGFRYDEKASD